MVKSPCSECVFKNENKEVCLKKCSKLKAVQLAAVDEVLITYPDYSILDELRVTEGYTHLF
jgi:predicted PilT family ATPase